MGNQSGELYNIFALVCVKRCLGVMKVQESMDCTESVVHVEIDNQEGRDD